MDILVGMFAYLAGIAALFGALALSLSVFSSMPTEPLAPQSTVAAAMRVAPSISAKTSGVETHAKQSTSRSEKHGKHAPPAAGPPDAARLATPARDINGDAQRKTAIKTAMQPAKARRLAQEDRARRWAYQQDAIGSSFERRFLGYAD